jgi:hypothetical protein
VLTSDVAVSDDLDYQRRFFLEALSTVQFDD